MENKVYTYAEIAKIAESKNAEIEEYGKFLVGASFIVINTQSETISYVMTNYSPTKGSLFVEIYNSNEI